MGKKSYAQAIAQALTQEMAGDAAVCALLGDDAPDGLNRNLYRELVRRFGSERVRDLAGETDALVAVAAGAVADGLRPVALLSAARFFGQAMFRVFRCGTPWKNGHCTRFFRGVTRIGLNWARLFAFRAGVTIRRRQRPRELEA